MAAVLDSSLAWAHQIKPPYAPGPVAESKDLPVETYSFRAPWSDATGVMLSCKEDGAYRFDTAGDAGAAARDPLAPPCAACGFGTGAAFVHTLGADGPRAGHGCGGLRFEWQEFDRWSDDQLLAHSAAGSPIHSNDRAFAWRVGGSYGLTDDVAIGFDLPWILNVNLRESATSGPPDIENNGNQSGLGDLSLFGQWTCLRDRNDDRYASLYAGARLPTGRTDLLAADGSRLEADHQPGSGSVDPFLGAAVSQEFGATTVGASLIYMLATRGSQESNLGDVLRVGLGVGWAPVMEAGQKVNWRWMLELQGEWHERSLLDGALDPNSGGTQLFVAPGVRASWVSGWSLYVSIGIPVLQDLYGTQATTEFRLTSGIGISF